MAAVDTRNKVSIDSDSKKVLAVLKRRNGIKTESGAINLAIRMAGTQMHIADINETNELLHQLVEALISTTPNIQKLTDNAQRNESILIRTFAYLRRTISEMDSQNGTQWLEAAENDFRAHISAKKQKDNNNE